MEELKFITEFYGDQVAKRSGVKLINHITEGIAILKRIKASDLAIRAFCLHPIVQSDKDLVANIDKIKSFDGDVVALAMEYRRVANAYLSTRKISSLDEIELSPMREVNDMLVADKIQNQKDFYLYHRGKHSRSQELEEYFENWFIKLGIDDNV